VNKLLLHSTKYDGSLHYRYPVVEIQRTEDRLTTFLSPGFPVESYRGGWTSAKYFLSTFWIGRPYVLHVRWDSAWTPEFLYVDITTGTNWNDQLVQYVDLDLDLILRDGSPHIHLDDEDEFDANRVRWNYPPELVKTCRDATGEVRRLLGSGKKPFSTSMFAWRPGAPVNW
jgi:uncharacterized protein